MAFKLLKDYFDIATEHALLNDSLTYDVGDVIAATGSANVTYITNLTAAVAGDVYPLGVLIGFCKADGSVISQGQDPSVTPNQLTTGATNVSTVKYHGVYIPIHECQEWDALLDANAGTTSYSAQQNVFFNLVDARTLDESTVVIANDGTAPLQVFSMGTIPQISSTTTAHVRIKFAKAKLTQP